MEKGEPFMVPSLMVVDIKHDATNQVLALLFKYDLYHKVREFQECLNVGGDEFPHCDRLAQSMVEDQIAFFLQD